MDKQEINRLAEKIQSLHKRHKTSTPFHGGYRGTTIGLSGEIAFGERYNLKPDLSLKPEGDGGIDFKIKIGEKIITFDIKTAQKAYNLLIKEKDIGRCADIIVLSRYNSDESVEFLGWASRERMQRQPVKVFSSLGIRNHYLNKDKLQSMEKLDILFSKFKVEQLY